MALDDDPNDPWVRGWLSGKYSQNVALPLDGEYEFWIEGFVAGCLAVGLYRNWESSLGVYVFGRLVYIYIGAADYFL